MLKVSFDFDGTLEDKVVQEYAKFIRDYYKCKICILTTRYSKPQKYSIYRSSESGKNHILKQFDNLNNIAKDLNITEIIYTNFKWKTEVIDNYNIDIHIDDNYRDEVIPINQKNKAICIHYDKYSKNWKNELLNLIMRKNNEIKS